MMSKRDLGLEQSFTAALNAAKRSPQSDEAWDHLEDLADSLQRPEEVGAVYREVLKEVADKELRDHVAERAVQFHEEWFGDSPSTIASLLSDILERDPDAHWAFDRITVVLTAAEEWEGLLAAYDRALAVTRDASRRRQLLNDASHVARDFATAPSRAADYMVELIGMEPGNTKLEISLARLLERQARWEDLINLWRAKLERLSPVEARDMRVTIARCYLDKLNQPKAALAELSIVVEELAGHPASCAELERILGDDKAAPGVRRDALALLRTNFDAVQKPRDVVRVLERALGFVEPREQLALHRELGSRLAILGDDAAAIQNYAALLRIEPADADARKQLRPLARRSENHDLHASALVEAADIAGGRGNGALSVSLLLEAAHLHRDKLDDVETAITLYRRVLDSPEAELASSLSAGHILNELMTLAGRDEERLAVLERLARIERTKVIRKAVLGEAAQLARKLGDLDRAHHDWKRRLELDDRDLEALNAVIELLDETERWDALTVALRRRTSQEVPPQQRRADLVRIAEIEADKIGRLETATSTWLEVREAFGESPEVIASLDRLMSATQSWGDLAELLEGSAGRGRLQAGALLTRVADVYRNHLSNPLRAAALYAEALAVDPASTGARAGMRELLAVESCARKAGDSLAVAFTATDDWSEVVAIVESRLGAATDDDERATILRAAATIYEDRAEDLAQAHAALARAFPLIPWDMLLESELMRLGMIDYARTADAFRDAALRAGETPGRAAHLSYVEGGLRERELEDAAGATDAYQTAARNDPQRIEYHEAAARCAGKASRWRDAAEAALHAAVARGRVEGGVIESLEQIAAEGFAYADIAAAFEAALVRRNGSMRSRLSWAIEMKVSGWYREAGDLAGGERAARRAVEHEPGHEASLQMLAALQRELKADGLVDTLLRLDELADHELDSLREAAEVALAGSDRGRARDTLVRLYRKSARMWARGETATGEHQHDRSALWALDRLVELHEQSGSMEQAVRILLDGATLPVDGATSMALRVRAAEMLANYGKRNRAIDLYLGVLADGGDSLDVLNRVATLCEEEGRTTELLGLRFQELKLTDDEDRRLELRLDISVLTGKLEARRGRVEVLQENLQERPGHEPSIAALEALLTERGRFGELTTAFEQQAALLTKAGENEAAAAIWTRAAHMAERSLEDLDRAIVAHERAVALSPAPRTLDALSRLLLKRDRAREAAKWLEQRLEIASEAENVAIRLKLARAYIAAEMTGPAAEALEVAFEKAPKNSELRKLLLGLYRKRESWDKLADALTIASGYVSDADTVLAYAREAAELYHERLHRPELSIQVLERAVTHAPDDRRLKTMLADGLRAGGRLEEAKVLLEELIEAFGRRRSPARAQAHLRLAKVFDGMGMPEETIKQLETASRMAAGDVIILRTLAEHARDAGQLDRAERAYRTLLVNVRRSLKQGNDDVGVGPCEVLFELSRISRARGDDYRADELVHSALEAVGESESELGRVKDTLREREEHELLRRVLEVRLRQVESKGHERADLLSELGEVLDGELGDSARALEVRLEALAMEPASPLRYDPARELAARLGVLDRYLTLLEELLEASRRDTDAHQRCEILLRIAEVMEKDHQDYRQATFYLDHAEATGVRKVDVWRAQARVAGAAGNKPLQVALLEQLVSLGADQAETRADALYRMAEVHLASAETIHDGVVSLSQALDDSPHYERAGMILRRACESLPADEQLLDLYQEVARKSGDQTMLLHFLEHRTENPGDDVRGALELAREGAALAAELVEFDREEDLMLRAVELSGELLEGKAAADWALVGLARRRHEGGDPAGAVKWLGEAIEAAVAHVSADVLTLAREVAEQAAQPGGDLTLAAKLYEHMVEREPTNRATWEPLAGIYRQLGDMDRLERLVDETLDGLQETEERNALRLQFAQALLRLDGRGDDAVRVLNDALLEEPENAEAQRMLAAHLEKTGDTAGLLDLLRNQLMAAQGRDDHRAIKALSLQLIARLRDDDLGEAIAVCQGALDAIPEDADLLRKLLELGEAEFDEHERGDLMERLLGVEEDGEVVALTLRLVALRRGVEDEDGALTALQLGYRRAPGHPELHGRLEQIYREREDHDGLLQLLLNAVEVAETPAVSVALLRQAASVQRELLRDAGAAVTLLSRAGALAPEDNALRVELAMARADNRDFAGAVETLGECLEAAADDAAARLDILQRRAGVHRTSGAPEAALSDLEQAFSIDRDAVAEALIVQLEELRGDAAVRGDRARERELTMRLIELRRERGAHDDARALLVGWIEQAPEDIDALRWLWAVDREAGHWEGVVETCERLVRLEQGEAQIEAAVGLADACEELGRSEDAREGLEYARDMQPEDQVLRDRLAVIYEAQGAGRELADVLLADARARDEAGAAPDDPERLDLLRRAGRLLVSCGDRTDAIPVLGEVLEATPDDRGTVKALVTALLEEGLHDDARATLTNQLERAKDDAWRLVLLRRRADVAHAAYALEDAVADLERAAAIDLAAVIDPLAEALEQLRGDLEGAGTNPARTREVTLRLADVEAERGGGDRVRMLLRDWADTNPDDLAVHQRLLRLERAGERWHEVIEIATHLLDRLEGDAQVEAALVLDDASARLDSPDLARAGLERVYEAQPDRGELRDRLRGLYEHVGDERALARILLAEASELEGDTAEKLDRLRRASSLLVDNAENQAALPVLGEIVSLAPTDREYAFILADTHVTEQDTDAALAVLSGLIERLEAAGEPILEVLQRRAQLHQDVGDGAAALVDLERAYTMDAAAVIDELAGALEQLRGELSALGNQAREREVTLRLAEVELDRGDRERVRLLLRDWTEEHPDDLDALQRLRRHETEDERWEEVAEVCERLVTQLEGDAQIEVAVALATACERLERPERARDGLERVHAAQPESAAIRDRLRALYEQAGDDRALATILIADAGGADDPGEKSTLLRRASALLVGVGDHEAALPVLTEVVGLNPTDREHVMMLADTHVGQGELAAAIGALTTYIERAEAAGDSILEAVQRRARHHQDAGDGEAALVDLERAYTIDADAVAEELEGHLGDLRDQSGDPARQRELTLRLIELLAARGRRDDARAQLLTWLEDQSEDVGALRRLRVMETEDERWEQVFDVCERLVELEEDAAQIEVTMGLVEAARKLERHTDARDGLEITRVSQPDNQQVRDELRQIYEAQGANRELAGILVDDAKDAEVPAEKLILLRRAGSLMLAAGDSESAIPVLQDVHFLDPDDRETTVTLIEAHTVAGQLDEADALIDEVLSSTKKKRAPELAPFYRFKARVAGQRGDRMKELEQLQLSYACDKGNGALAGELANLAEDLEQWDLATKVLRGIALMEPDSGCPISKAESYYRQGRITKITGDLKRAAFWARRALQEDADLTEAAKLLEEIGA